MIRALPGHLRPGRRWRRRRRRPTPPGIRLLPISAEVTVDYTKVNSGIAMDDSSFAWSPPAGATLATTTPPANPAGDSDIAAGLGGKPGPGFSLAGVVKK